MASNDTICHGSVKVLKLASSPGQKLFESFETASGGGMSMFSGPINYTLGSFTVTSSNPGSSTVSINSLASEGTP